MNKETFLKQYQKKQVSEYPNAVSKSPVVSVCVQTYKHVGYIKKCLEGLLMQETNFDFEILLGEDASNDGTREICLEYAKKYPQKIRLFLHHRENNIKVYGIPTGRFNFHYNLFNAKGKYICICEGDDHWIEKSKLQKQVDFLEGNHEYGMVYSDIELVLEKAADNQNTQHSETLVNRYSFIRDRYTSGQVFWQLLDKNFINTLTICVRKDLMLDYLSKFSEEFAYDHRLWLHVASYSKIKFINEKFGAYRVLDSGISHTSGFFHKRAQLVKQSALINYLEYVGFDRKQVDKKVFAKVLYNILNNKHLSKQEKGPSRQLLKKHPMFVVDLVNWRISKIFKKVKF